MKAKIYQDSKDGQGIVLSGEVVSFYLGTGGWNLVMRGSGVVKEHPELFDTIIDLNKTKVLKGGYKESKSKAEIDGGKIWIGFRLESGVRVQIGEGL